MTENKKIWFSVCGALALFYIALRLWRLTDSCLWFDEVFSLHAAGLEWNALFGFVALDLIHPPLFYILLKLWITLGGESLFWVRLLPVLFSVTALLPFYLLCRQIKLSERAIALALLFFAVNGYLIKYAQEVRMYGILLCLSLFSLWLFARFLNVGKGIWVLTLINILLVHTHYFGWFLILGEILAILHLQRIKIGQILIMAGGTTLSFFPWIFKVFQNGGIGPNAAQNLGWANRPGLLEILGFIFNLNEPFYYQASSISPLTIPVITLPLLLILLTAAGFYLADWKVRSEKEKNAFYFLVIILATPILLGFIGSWLLPFSVWGTRHFIIIFAPYSILLAKILDGIQLKQLKNILNVCVPALFVLAFIGHFQRGEPKYIWCGWEQLATQIPVGENDPTRLFSFEDESAYLLWFALRNREDIRIFKVNGQAGIPEDAAYFLPRGFEKVEKTDPDGMTGERFYIAFRAADFNYLKPPLRDLIEKGYRVGEPKVFEAQGLKTFLVEIKR